jgi:4-hydroxybenzoate polyprenyltransferase
MSPLLKALRPRQWIKNLVVFAGLAFSGQALDFTIASRAAIAFALFCVASSGVYLFNDLLDRERDSLHPVKRLRSIASGALPASTAAAVAVLLAGGALAASLTLELGSAWQAIGGYLLLQLAYTLHLKHVFLLDVFSIAAGFLLRVLAGVWAIEAPLSPWLVACTVQLALFLALCKRKAEVTAVGEGSTAQRPLLEEYGGPGLDVMVSVVAAALLVTYTLYTLLPGALLALAVPESRAGEPGMIWTIPFVAYGVLRYLYLVYRQERGERPEKLLTGDVPLFLTVAGYGGVVGWVVYV